MYRQFLIGIGLALALTTPATAQRVAGEWAWKPLLRHDGVAFDYLFYREADNVNNGVVLKLANTNDYAVDYRFKVVFRADDGTTHVEPVEGTLGAGEVQTPVVYRGPETLNLGDPVFMRHAKAGEVCERFRKLLLISKGQIVGDVTTYRGDEQCFV